MRAAIPPHRLARRRVEPSARLSPAAVGTANRAGWMKANSSSSRGPTDFGIAEPLPDQRRIEDDVRRFGGPGDSFAAGGLAGLAVGCAIQMPAWVAWQAGMGIGDDMTEALVPCSFPLASAFCRP